SRRIPPSKSGAVGPRSVAAKTDSLDWIIVVCGAHRSGTTALRSTLGRGRYIRDYGEIFNERDAGSDHNFFRLNFFKFKRQRIAESPDLAVPSPGNQAKLWHGYVEALRAATRKQFAILDVKYGRWHHLDPGWHLPRQRPMLID